MTYSIDNKSYLGKTQDMSHKEIHGFNIDNNIHLVHDLNKETETSQYENIDKIKNNPDAYIWTPYSDFVNLL